MRMSCNGCRVLRKGCSDACTIRPCLQWIKSPEAQANATVFLAKFYGRAGLLNLLAAPPADALRPAVFRSLLYEACGRIVNPVYGSVGLLWSGQWQACQAAVEAVLKGHPVVQVDAASDAAAAPPQQLLGGRRYDIRHVARDRDPDADAAADLLRVARGGGGRKRAAESSKPSGGNKRRASSGPGNDETNLKQKPRQDSEEEPEPVPIVVEHGEESAGSHDHHLQAQAQEGSEDTDVEAASHSHSHSHHSHVSQAEPDAPPVSSQRADHDADEEEEEEEVGLELTLGLEPLVRQPKSSRCEPSGQSAASSLICLRLQLPA